ncbi:hypothetical protein CYMTET_46883 [Cymbomonas tetramitiformis]|uniref:Uncharacterized protein n=1 Tax=Cymbomonas tetramitiformis TaxID=36881 RepID=A0AAE0BWU8_9CHLO|nr:hypothetical protein CYMTET_46883 [Cymbomonas tetramitiformis]
MQAGAADKTIIAWDTATHQQLRVLKGHTAGVHSLALSPDGRTLYSGGADKCIRVWQTEDGRWLRSFAGAHTGFVTALAVSPDGQVLFSGCDGLFGDSAIKAWRTADGECACTTAGQAKGINMLVVSPDGTALYSASGDGMIVAREIRRGTRSFEQLGTKMKHGFLTE